MRVLVTGMGGELGTRVTLLLEAEQGVREIVGVDADPPRRRLRRSEFRRVDPRDRDRLAAVVREVGPTAVVHLGVYEPDARAEPALAAERTTVGAVAVLGAAGETGALERVVVRSGIEIYGRRRGEPAVPDEEVPPHPTSSYGRTLLRVEAVAAELGARTGVPVALLRTAPIVGPHFPSPLGRLLRMPAVPFEALSDPPFALLHQEDAARAIVAALLRGIDGPVNVVAPGVVTASQAARLGSRIPIPVTGPGWAVAARLAELAGAPVPSHVRELLRRGRRADASRAAHVLGVAPAYDTPEVVRALYEWAPVTHLRVIEGDAAGAGYP